MLANTNYLPMKTFANTKNQNTRSTFTYNLHDLRYKNNGQGRDSYIYGSNGGFSIEHKVAQNQNSPGRFLPKISRQSLSPNISSAIDLARPKYYNPDGTGRDTYVISNNGGFTSYMGEQVAIDPRITFKHSLRSYEPDAGYLERRNYYKILKQYKQKSPEPYTSEEVKSSRPLRRDGYQQPTSALNYVSTYRDTMNGQRHTTTDVTQQFQRVHEAIAKQRESELLSDFNTVDFFSKDDNIYDAEILKQSKTLALNFPATAEKDKSKTERFHERLHPNSVDPMKALREVRNKSPTIGAYNPSPESVQKLSNYIGKMSQRLSRPKMHSVINNSGSNLQSQANIHSQINNIAHLEPRGSINRLASQEKLQAAQPQGSIKPVGILKNSLYGLNSTNDLLKQNESQISLRQITTGLTSGNLLTVNGDNTATLNQKISSSGRIFQDQL